MIKVTLDLRLGTAQRLLQMLDPRPNKDKKAAEQLLEALETQAIPQIDEAIQKMNQALGKDQ